MVIQYSGHHALERFIQAQIIRFDYKLLALCCTSSYFYYFDLYCSKNLSDQWKDLQLGSQVVLNMLDAVEELQSHNVFLTTLLQVI